MNEHGPKPVLWSTILLRVAMLLVLLTALVVAFAPKLANLFSPQRRLTTSGDPADIRLVGVVPDGDDVLLDGRGNVVPGVKFDWPGKRTYTWPPGTMLREFLFELGPDSADLEFRQSRPGSVEVAEIRSWIPSTTYALDNERVLSPDGRRRFLFRATMSTNSWRGGFLFSSRQPPVEEIDLELFFYGPKRTQAALNFEGPFTVGKTNSERDSKSAWLTALAKSSEEHREVASFDVRWTGYDDSWQQVFVYDAEGKRHPTQTRSWGAGSPTATNQFDVPGLPLEKIAAVTFGEQPRVKRFHNILVKYPDRPSRPHAAAVLERLAIALGKTNTPPVSLEHIYPSSTREAMIVLEHLPGHRNAVVVLANASSSTNFSELTPAQREKLRALAAVWADIPDTYERDTGLTPAREKLRSLSAVWGYIPDTYERDTGLRLGLRGGWPEFLALALARLTNGTAKDRVSAVYALGLARTQIGAEHVPLISALIRSNENGNISSSLLGLLQRAGPAGTNGLLELARADAPWVWWSAISRLHTRAFEPVASLSHEMQQRLWLVREHPNRPAYDAVRVAALSQLPGLLTPELQRRDPYVFSSAFQRLQYRADRPTAMAAMVKFLRDSPPAQLQSHPPADLVRQINVWYKQDFGGLGAKPEDPNRSPSPSEWPGIVEEVLQFCDKLERGAAAEK